MGKVGWWVAPFLSSLPVFQREGGWLNSTAFTPLYKLSVWKVGQLDGPNPEGTLYC